MKKILMLLLSCNTLYALGSTYYIDNKKGDDIFDGKSPAKAWKTLTKINKQTFMPGDSVLFKRDGIWEGQLAPSGSGAEKQPVVFGAYGTGALPEIKAGGYVRDGILLKNVQYLVIEHMAVSNLDSSVPFQKNGPTGVRLLADNAGTLHNIRLANLYIHDINGDNKKGTNEGCGIFWDCQGPIPSNFEHLTIENCKLVRIDRNGIRGNGTFGIRSNWFPNKHLVIRNCTMDDIGGDGIVIKAFDNALVEHNQLFHIRARAKDNAVAIWPHSSDNTTIQYNEVAYTRNGNWANDGQSFDIDGNCHNTIIQYNYSHDNEGGFMLVISDAINKDNMMTKGNIIRYNLSVNDGLNRKRLFNFAGVTDSTIIKGNVFYNNAAKHYTMEIADIENGIATNVVFEDNYFSYTGGTPALFTKSPKQYGQFFFNNNYFGGYVFGLDNLPNRKDKIGAYNRGETKKPKGSFPWLYLPAKLRSQTNLFPDDLFRSYYGKN
ncbi:right-handed parallel beta-helix repeat-containing protein [Mucilaginibacter boryungensis]|uniref:Right-handed parallel beta-helix repeat-containing protein n=1 Tax=Mucilaginibacter boryungensis TaxID=768480 RepID=A0ABR9XEB4_9SPHI|nr:right-handed parallel beta-helix repeat-containing protein [Mucilaginibacter boryungensis]MBE9665733.1 right-handed parallel beta-helix repeat-containing protein [Mucilaginibacter boryungensis]